MFAWLRISLLLAAVALSAPASASERMRVPPLKVVSADGRAVALDQLVRPGRWLLVYIQPNCGPCDALLRLVKKGEHPLVPSQLVIVVGATTAEAVSAEAASFPDLTGAAWYADPARAAIAPLRLTGAPVIFGVDHDVIEWRLAGVLSNADDVKSVLASWVEKP